MRVEFTQSTAEHPWDQADCKGQKRGSGTQSDQPDSVRRAIVGDTHDAPKVEGRGREQHDPDREESLSRQQTRPRTPDPRSPDTSGPPLRSPSRPSALSWRSQPPLRGSLFISAGKRASTKNGAESPVENIAIPITGKADPPDATDPASSVPMNGPRASERRQREHKAEHQRLPRLRYQSIVRWPPWSSCWAR